MLWVPWPDELRLDSAMLPVLVTFGLPSIDTDAPLSLGGVADAVGAPTLRASSGTAAHATFNKVERFTESFLVSPRGPRRNSFATRSLLEEALHATHRHRAGGAF